MNSLAPAAHARLRLAAVKVLCERSLRDFVRHAWHVLEPATPLLPGWHIDAICEHLEAQTRGQLKRLVVNMPPRHGKSLLVTVFWPAWEWATRPATQWIFSSYAQTLSTRDSRKCRRLILSPWYRALWGGRYQLTSDQNAKLRFENSSTGVRLATSVGATGTGEGGDRIVVDDPHKRGDVDSPTKRGRVLTWWDEEMSTRGNSAASTETVVMQRLHHQDLSGHLLESGLYEHLCLPAEYEPRTHVTAIGFEDPREERGDLLWPARFDREGIEDLKARLGSPYAVAGQLQQRPTPREGGIIKAAWVRRIARKDLPEFEVVIQSWDFSHGSKSDSASFCVGEVWGAVGPDHYLIHQTRERMHLPEMMDGVRVMTTHHPEAFQKVIENKAHGRAILETMHEEIEGLIPFDPGTASKVERLEAVAPIFRNGHVYVVEDVDWFDGPGGWLFELTNFPNTQFDDQVDATTQALLALRESGHAPETDVIGVTEVR